MKREPDLPAVAAGMVPVVRAGGFRETATAIVVVLVWLLAWYRGTALEVASIWWRSETFAHGLVVFPVFAWLVWRGRDRLGGLSPAPSAWPVAPLALAGLGWLLGEIASVAALAHASLFAMLVLALVAVLGPRVSRVLAFPLLFLLFGVPVGEFLLPVLMDYTAAFTVGALRLSGVPVYQEGLLFVVPNGRWSVVEACSGIRYLIASVTVGSLYAYLNYRSLTRRLLFVGVSIVVPIVANWVRAYLIVMLGYLSDNRIAAGVDHLIYGWLFFGVVILVMFWIGMRWREDPPSYAVPRPEVAARGGFRRWLPVLPAALVTAAFPLIQREIEEPVAPFAVALEMPAPKAGWALADESFHDYRPVFRGHRGETFQSYRHADGGVVGLYIAYYAMQRPGAELVMWGNGLTGTERGRWSVVSEGRDALPVGTVRRAVLANYPEKLAVWSWYWANQRVIISDPLAKAFLALDQVAGQPDDSAFVAVIASVEERPDEARPMVDAFLRDHAEAIDAMLRRAEVER